MEEKTSSNFEVVKTDEEWKAELSSEEYKMLRLKGTERPFTGEYYKYDGDGLFICAGCDNPLFNANAKYESGSGWPSFWEPVSENSVLEKQDNSLGMIRTELVCGKCGGHLGHLFEDGPQPTGLRYCINSASLDLKKEKE